MFLLAFFYWLFPFRWIRIAILALAFGSLICGFIYAFLVFQAIQERTPPPHGHANRTQRSIPHTPASLAR